MFGRDVGGSKSEYDFALGVVGVGEYLLGLPCDLVVFEGVGGGDALAVHDQKLFVEVYADVDVEEAVFPLFVEFVLEGELDVAGAHFAGVDEQQRHLVRSE